MKKPNNYGSKIFDIDISLLANIVRAGSSKLVLVYQGAVSIANKRFKSFTQSI